MTVKELMEELQKRSSDAVVIVTDHEGFTEEANTVVEMETYIYLNDKSRLTKCVRIER